LRNETEKINGKCATKIENFLKEKEIMEDFVLLLRIFFGKGEIRLKFQQF
jgi:hypothetical protein